MKDHIITIILCIAFGYGVVSFFKDDQEWLGFVYPDKNNLLHDIQIGAYSSLDSCRSAAHSLMSEKDWVVTGTYECGLNCKYDGGIGLYICKETRQ